MDGEKENSFYAVKIWIRFSIMEGLPSYDIHAILKVKIRVVFMEKR